MKKRMAYTGAIAGAALLAVIAMFQAVEGASALQLLERFGLPVAFLLIVLYFGARYVWPYILEKDRANVAAQDKFSETVRQMSAEHGAAMNKVVEAMTALKDEMREGRRQR